MTKSRDMDEGKLSRFYVCISTSQLVGQTPTVEIAPAPLRCRHNYNQFKKKSKVDENITSCISYDIFKNPFHSILYNLFSGAMKSTFV